MTTTSKAQILKQVKSMHEIGYLHSWNLLPCNAIFYGDDGYLIDFDLSRKEDELYVAGYN
jgi:tRNA A-37 threonylcarbamoyl transferase component Bud32